MKKQRSTEKRKEKILKFKKYQKRFFKYLSMKVLVKYNKGLGMNLVPFVKYCKQERFFFENDSKNSWFLIMILDKLKGLL